VNFDEILRGRFGDQLRPLAEVYTVSNSFRISFRILAILLIETEGEKCRNEKTVFLLLG
jgi:hypothetical protein